LNHHNSSLSSEIDVEPCQDPAGISTKIFPILRPHRSKYQQKPLLFFPGLRAGELAYFLGRGFFLFGGRSPSGTTEIYTALKKVMETKHA
jgi:hypothetical protein